MIIESLAGYDATETRDGVDEFAWVMFAGLGPASSANGVIAGALWAGTFDTHQVGMVRGVCATFAVPATAVSPYLLGEAKSVPMAWIAAASGALRSCPSRPQ